MERLKKQGALLFLLDESGVKSIKQNNLFSIMILRPIVPIMSTKISGNYSSYFKTPIRHEKKDYI